MTLLLEHHHQDLRSSSSSRWRDDGAAAAVGRRPSLRARGRARVRRRDAGAAARRAGMAGDRGYVAHGVTRPAHRPPAGRARLDDRPAVERPRGGIASDAASAAVARVLGIIWTAGRGREPVRPARRTHPSDLDRIARRPRHRRPVGRCRRHRACVRVAPSAAYSPERPRVAARHLGLRRAKVLLPADALDWPADRIRIVLGHELAHVRRRDWVVQMAAELCAASTGSIRSCGWRADACVSRASTRATTRC